MKGENLGDFLSTHYRKIMIGVGVIMLVCIVALIGLGISRISPPGTYLDINVAPSTAKITINGQEYRNGVYEFEPGAYTVEISQNGFESQSVNVNVEKGKTARVATYLLNKKEGMEYFERSEADINILRSVDDSDVENFISKYDEKLSIREKLPIDASYDMSEITGQPGNDIYEQIVTDGSRDPACEKAFCLLVSGYRLNEDALRNKIADLGYNLDDYEVLYAFEY